MIHVGRCNVQSGWRNRHAPQFPLGYYCAVEVIGPNAIMTTTPNRRDATQQKLQGSRRS
jgi:hypothetical protein